MSKQRASELLLPAGSLKSMRYAFAYGADAVYAGQPRYSLRVRNNEFSYDKLALGIEEAHQKGKQLFVVSNVIPHNNKVRTYIEHLEPVIAAKPDALIMSDPGLIMMVREKWPDMPIHLSVQSNVTNFATVKFWEAQGVTRIILSRELNIKEIRGIREECPNIELETFVHGALCMAYSGRCMLSGYMNHRDPNQGACTNACRWKYDVNESKEDEWGNAEVQEKTYLVEEKQRPGEHMSVEEDAHGTYIFNSKDLRAIQHIAELIEIGVDCFKIEGRTKSHYYAARTAQLYRKAIDDALAGKAFDMNLFLDLEGLSTRGYTEGFYRHQKPEEYQSYEEKAVNQTTQQFVGEIDGFDAQNAMLEVEVKNRFHVGDKLELMLPKGNLVFNLSNMESDKGEKMDVAPGSGYRVRIPLNADVKPEDISMGLLIRHNEAVLPEPVV